MAESTEHAEAQVIKQFIPTLVVAVCDCVQGVSDKCLAKGLISESTSKRVLDLRGGTSEERARTLIHSVHTSTKTDRSCFQIFLEVLHEELPYRVREKVLSDMKKELADRAAVMCKAVVHVSQESLSRSVPLDQGLGVIQQQSSFLGRYEDAVSKHASAATQKSLIEETLKSRSEESGRLRASLDMLSQSHDNKCDEKQITSTRNRISVCESEIANLRERIEELERIIEEENMRARRGRNTITVETKRLLEEFTKQSQEQFLTVLKNKEQEHKRILAEKEAEIRKEMQEEMNLEIKDLKHEVALLNKEVKIKDLQLSMKQKGQFKGNAEVSKFTAQHRLSSHPLVMTNPTRILSRGQYPQNHNQLQRAPKHNIDENHVYTKQQDHSHQTISIEDILSDSSSIDESEDGDQFRISIIGNSSITNTTSPSDDMESLGSQPFQGIRRRLRGKCTACECVQQGSVKRHCTRSPNLYSQLLNPVSKWGSVRGKLIKSRSVS